MRTKKNNLTKLSNVLSVIKTALNDLKEKEQSGESIQPELEKMSDQINDLLTSDAFFVNLMLGTQKFHDNTKRRSTRKPLTVKRMQNLSNDLFELSRILNI